MNTKIKSTIYLASCCVALCTFGSAFAAVSPIDVTGWDWDIVLNNPAPHDLQVNGTMDGGLGFTIEGWTWVEAGDYTNVDGLTETFRGLSAGTHSSLTGNGTFEFQPFTSNNSIAIDGANPTGTLTLTNPEPYKSLAFYGGSAYGAKTIDILLTFADTSTTTLTVAEGTGVGTDWFNTNADRAMIVGGRASNKGEEGYTRLFYQDTDDLALNESFFTLSPADQAKDLTSVTFFTTAGDRTSILAMSGELTASLAEADFNSDTFVDGTDLGVWETGYGMGTGATRSDGDATGDGAVTGADFLVWQRQFTGPSAVVPTVSAIPEPTTAAIVLSAWVFVAGYRRSRNN